MLLQRDGVLVAAHAAACGGGCRRGQVGCCISEAVSWWLLMLLLVVVGAGRGRPIPGRKHPENTTADKNRASTRRGKRREENKEDEAWPSVVGWKKDRNERNQKARAVWMQRMKGV